MSITGKNGDTGSLEGTILISLARTGEGGPFDRAVVLLCSHGKDGAMGLIVNNQFPKPTLADLFNEFEIDAETDLSGVGVHFGGPVDRGRGFILHGADYECEGTLPVTPEIRLTIAQTILSDMAAGRGPKKFIVAMGYAGWDADQLEGELQRNMWLCGEAEADIVFAPESDAKWDLALQRIGISPANLVSQGGQA